MSSAAKNPTEPYGSRANVTPLFGLSQRLPPTNLPAEQALLGALLANNAAWDRLPPGFRSDHFADPANRVVFEAVKARIEAGRLADVVTLRQDFEATGRLDEVGGLAYLAQLLTAMVGVVGAGEYARAVMDAWQRRQLVAAGEALVNAAFDGQIPPAEAASAVVRRVDDTVGEAGGSRAGCDLAEAVDAALEMADRKARGESALGVLTGMPSLDHRLGALERGSLTVLAGRPGSGKSSLGLQWALHAGEQAQRVFYFSLEMPAAQLGRRALALVSSVPIWRLKLGRHSAEVPALLQARRKLLSLPVHLDDASRLSIAELASRVRSMARKRGQPALIVVDHLHIMAHDAGKARNGEHLAIADTTQRLKQLAKTMDCAVLALAQLKRPQAGYEESRPSSRDLRQSGGIEEDADTILLIHRPEQHADKAAPTRRASEREDQFEKRLKSFNEFRERSAGLAELLIAKSRDGGEAMVTLRFDGPTARFNDPTPAEEQDAQGAIGDW